MVKLNEDAYEAMRVSIFDNENNLARHEEWTDGICHGSSSFTAASTKSSGTRGAAWQCSDSHQKQKDAPYYLEMVLDGANSQAPELGL
jgi:hypothetical protein